MPTPQTGMPPMSPDVKAQQQNSLAQYGQQAAANGAQPGAAPASSTQLVQKLMTEIAERMGKVAKVLQAERPELIPVLKQMAGAGKALETELQKTQGQGSPSDPGSEPSQTAPEGPDSMGAN